MSERNLSAEKKGMRCPIMPAGANVGHSTRGEIWANRWNGKHEECRGFGAVSSCLA